MLKHLALLFLFGGAIETVWFLSRGLSPLRAHSGSFITLMLLSFALCLLSFFRCRLRDRRDVLCMLGFALLFRLTVLPATPDESEDVYRYLWDGKISSAGISPYLHPPEAPELESFRDPLLYPMLNSKSYITVYPPLSQAVFRACYGLFGPSVLAMKAVFSLFEFASLLLAWRLLVSFGTGLQPLFLMAWNPFFVFEFSHSGHSDSLTMFLILLSIYLGHRRKSVWAMASFAGAILVKLHPALWIPLFWRRMGWKPAAVCLSLVGIGMYGSFSFQTLRSYVQSLRLYYRLFEFNAGIHYLLRFIGSSFFRQSWDKAAGPYLAVLLIVVVVGIVVRFPLANARDVLHAGFWVMTADLCLATTVHPWYLVWAALALPVLPYAFMFYWTGACFLSYLAYAHSPVYEPRWVLLVEYLPMYALMVWEIFRGAPLLQASDRVKAGRRAPVLPPAWSPSDS